MRIIRTMKDIDLLKRNHAVNDEILSEIEGNFRYDCCRSGEMPLGKFSLDKSGLIVLLEPGDNVTDLREIGLNPEDGGLLGTEPRWIDKRAFKAVKLITACISSNKKTLKVYFEEGKLGREVQNWVIQNI